MSFNTEQFLIDHKIEFTTRHHHVSSGWAGIEICPFCGSDNYKFGIHLKTGACSCWMCGGHSTHKTIELILKADQRKIKFIMGKYGSKDPLAKAPRRVEEEIKECKWPDGIETPMPNKHFNYLKKRNFASHSIVSKHGIKCTGPFSVDYKFRLIIPVHYKRQMVSYVGRDVTGKSELKYKACSKKNETRFHRHCLYGLDDVKGKSVIVVEGITDVWRLGIGAVATFGVKWSMPQAEQLLKFDRVFILYDMEEKAQEAARGLGSMLACNGVEVEQLELQELDEGKDPADMKQDDADNLMKELGIKK